MQVLLGRLVQMAILTEVRSLPRHLICVLLLIQGLVAGFTVAESNGTVYFGSYDGYLYAVDIETGEEKFFGYELDYRGC